MSTNSLYAKTLTLTTDPNNYNQLILLKRDHKIGKEYSIAQAYNLCVSLIKAIEDWNVAFLVPTEFKITSDALLKLRDYEEENNKKPFEITAKLILEERVSGE